jgi:adenylate cyclase
MSPGRAARRRRAWSRPVAIGAVTAAAGLIFMALPPGAFLEEWAGLNLLFKLRGPRTPPSDVLIVAIDRPAAEALGLPSNPNRWPRTQHAELVDALHRGGAATIVLDIVFDEPGAPVDDRTLAESVRRAGTVVLAQQLVRESVPVPGADPRASPDPFHLERLAPPLPSLAEAVAGLAPFPLPKVPVRVSRYWTFKAGAGNAPSLPVVAFHVYEPESHGPLVALLQTVGASAPDGSPLEGLGLHSSGHAEHAVRALREAVEKVTLLPGLASMERSLAHQAQPRKRGSGGCSSAWLACTRGQMLHTSTSTARPARSPRPHWLPRH